MIASLHNGITALKSLTQGLQVLGNNISMLTHWDISRLVPIIPIIFIYT